MKKVKLTEAEFKTEKDTGKLTLREALAQDAGLPIDADISRQIGPRYVGPDVEGHPWGSTLWSHALTEAADGSELQITEEDADKLEVNHGGGKGDVRANILAKIKNAKVEAIEVGEAEPIEAKESKK
jgi:hypothetical protein